MKKYKRGWYILAVVVLAVSMLGIGGCGAGSASSQKEAEEQSSGTTFTGKLTNAMDNVLVVTKDDDVRSFKTKHDTNYDFGDQDHLSISDTVEVSYYEEDNKMFAEEVTVTEHTEEELEFKGTVSDLNNNTLTVKGKSLTATFSYGDDTTVKGKLTEGDDVEITYTGDLSELPHAKKITVTKENDSSSDHKVSGTVADGLEKTMLLTVDSSHAYRFSVDKNTKVTGVSKEVKKGDEVEVTYTGDLDKSPKATAIKVVKKAKNFVIYGTVKSYTSKALTINTGKKQYSITVDSKTKYSGSKPATGLKATVTYSGDLNKSPYAVSVYCSKQAASKAKSTASKSKSGSSQSSGSSSKASGSGSKSSGSGSKTPSSDSGKKSSEKKSSDTQPSKKDTKPTPEPAPAPTPKPTPQPTPEPEVAVEAEGTLVQWVDEDHISCIVQIDKDTKIELAVNDDTKVSAGYKPMAGDKVKITYMKSNKLLKDIQLIDRPEADPDDEDVDAQSSADVSKSEAKTDEKSESKAER